MVGGGELSFRSFFVSAVRVFFNLVVLLTEGRHGLRRGWERECRGGKTGEEGRFDRYATALHAISMYIVSVVSRGSSIIDS